MRAMRFARIDHSLKLRIREETIAQNGGWQLRTVAGFWWCDRGHSCRLHQLGRVRFRPRDVDRLQPKGLINCIQQARAGIVFGRIAQAIGEVCSLDLRGGVGGGCCWRGARCADGRARGSGGISRKGGSGEACAWVSCVQHEARRDMGRDQRQQAGHIRRYRVRQIGGNPARLATATFVEY